jgi:hypothetical protein
MVSGNHHLIVLKTFAIIPSILSMISLHLFSTEPYDFGTTKADLSDEKEKKNSKWLRNHIKGGGWDLENPPTKHSKMIRGEGGVCSDMSQVYNNFCVINDLKSKEVGLKIVSKNDVPWGPFI